MLRTWEYFRLPLWISLGFLFVLLILTYTTGEVGIWHQFAIDDGIRCFFCEVSYMDHLVREPINTITNLPFLFLGIVVLLVAQKDRRAKKTHNLLVSKPVYSYLFAFSLLFLFLGSTFFHASLIKFGQQWDMAGVYALVLFPISYNAHRWYNLAYYKDTTTTSKRALKYVLTLFFLALILLTALKWQMNSAITIPVMMSFVIVSTVYLSFKTKGGSNKRVLNYGIIAILGGFACYALDLRKVGCDENVILSPHAVWHIAAAASAFFLYIYLRSENNLKFSK